MTYYTDLSPYEYFPESVPSEVTARNIGWLDTGQDYTRGPSPKPFLEGLSELVRDGRQMQTRGWHRCLLPHDNEEAEYPISVNIADVKVSLGGAEIRVVAESGDWLIAPDLVYHYVTEHSYRPPQAFIEAVTARRVASINP
ncbi:DUF7919 family protein [Streptomyces spiralis]